jgi:biopolymer transport protein ExbB
MLCLCITPAVFARHDHQEHMQVMQQLEQAKQRYSAAQSQLQRVTDNRWSARKRQVDKKAEMQQHAENIQREIERLYATMGRVREELIVRQTGLADVESEREQYKESFEWIGKTFESILEKEENAIRAGFPVGQQQRSLQLQDVMNPKGGRGGSVKARLSRFHAYVRGRLKYATQSAFSRETILADGNNPHEAVVLRLGEVCAVGVSDTGDVFYLGKTGTGESAGGFDWIPLSSDAAAQNLRTSMPLWMKQGHVAGNLHVDVMQNKYSESLLGQRQQGLAAKTASLLRKGGVLMIPLGILCLWALVLICNRLIVFTLAHSRDNRFIDEAVEYLNKRKMVEAANLASRSRGVLARILKTCLNHAQWKRPVAEKAVKEFLLAEVPVLDKHLDSLAVIAGAAPLLGLLGTVTGMIRMFESITRFGAGDPKLLAGGISEALITTEVGLAIAIPVLLVHNFLRNRRNHLQADMEMYAMRILNRLWPQE